MTRPKRRLSDNSVVLLLKYPTKKWRRDEHQRHDGADHAPGG